MKVNAEILVSLEFKFTLACAPFVIVSLPLARLITVGLSSAADLAKDIEVALTLFIPVEFLTSYFIISET